MRSQPILAGLLATLLPTASAATTPSKTIQTCNDLALALPPRRVTYPTNPAYITESTNYWSSALSATRPACIIFAESSSDVSTFVQLIRSAPPEVKWAVKSGGHSPNLGWATADGGVLLSLGNMKGATYDEDKGLAYVYPGGHWRDVVGDLAPYGRTVVGGRLDMVGVGGYLTGGGVSFLSSQYGMAADNVIDFETVMANGSIVNINARTNPDLLIAMRGGGNQFGIVTKFTMKTVPMAKVWGGPIMFSDSNRALILAAFHNFTANPVDPKAAVIMSLARVGQAGVWVLHRFYDGPVAPKGAFMGFEDLWHIPGLDYGGTRTYGELLALDSSGGDILAMGRTNLRGLTLPLLPSPSGIQTLSTIIETWYTQFQPYQDANFMSIASIALQSFPSNIGVASASRGGNALGLTSTDKPRVMIELATIHQSPGSDKIAWDCGRETEKRVKELVGREVEGLNGRGVEVEGNLPLSLNHASFDQDVYSSYRGFEKFRGLQKSVDPEGLWRRTGGFKFKE